MSQANEQLTTTRPKEFAPTFDVEERAALEAFGFHFESTEGHEAAELKGRCQVTVIPPQQGAEFGVLISTPNGTLIEAHTTRDEIVW